MTVAQAETEHAAAVDALVVAAGIVVDALASSEALGPLEVGRAVVALRGAVLRERAAARALGVGLVAVVREAEPAPAPEASGSREEPLQARPRRGASKPETAPG